MIKGLKDSTEVVQFMVLFARLKEWTDDSAEGLIELAEADEGLKKLCNDLSWAAFVFGAKEQRGRALYTAPVDPAFLSAWRDYEVRYQSAIAEIWLSDILPERASGEPSNLSKSDQQWEWTNADAQEKAAGIEAALDFARENIEQDHDFDDDLVKRIDDGIAGWEGLKHEVGIDLEGIFRRRALAPFVLVPRNVSNKYGSAERLSMLKNLQQAHDAFVFGVSYAALALMRSIAESVLRDHYNVDGRDFCERINNAQGRLPRSANIAALHRLRKLGNAILHLKAEDDGGLPKMDEQRLEKEIVSLLFVLRALIEGVK